MKVRIKDFKKSEIKKFVEVMMNVEVKSIDFNGGNIFLTCLGTKTIVSGNNVEISYVAVKKDGVKLELVVRNRNWLAFLLEVDYFINKSISRVDDLTTKFKYKGIIMKLKKICSI